ncbi:MAG TPA: response regulator [Spirochaetia bacterium]|nr:response regulator [Spirochaetia bacterium]
MAELPQEEQPVVLVVEDNQVNRMVARQMLKRGNVVAEEADGARRALEILRERRFDLVLMDVQMPGMDGLEATRAIRNGDAGDQNRGVPIVAITAYASSDDEQACYEAGMDAYLSKPLNMQKFLDTVTETITSSRRSPQGPDA